MLLTGEPFTMRWQGGDMGRSCAFIIRENALKAPILSIRVTDVRGSEFANPTPQLLDRLMRADVLLFNRRLPERPRGATVSGGKEFPCMKSMPRAASPSGV